MKKSDSQSNITLKPAQNPEVQEQRMIGLAVDLAEKQLREGTASSQVITHYLKLAATEKSVVSSLRY